MNEFETMKLLGKGAFASVYQVKRKKDGNIYAMKRVKFGAMSSKEKDNAVNEIRILASVQHANIIGYKESFYDEESKTLNIIMDYADEGDLDGRIKKHVERRTNFPENEIWTYLIQILQGLKSLHSAKIMHRDLKCANIFLKSGTIKLGDLNVSKLIKLSQMDHTQTGTPYYASPEVWSNKPYDYKSDIWSVGCIIYELCALRPPFRGNGLEELYKAVLKGKYDPLPKIYSQDLQMIIGVMLQVNTALRPDVYKMLTNPLIIKKIDYSTLSNQDKESLNMLNTIKVPKNLKEINQQLPKKKNYDIGEALIERNNSEENIKKPRIMDRPEEKVVNVAPKSNIPISNNQQQYKLNNPVGNQVGNRPVIVSNNQNVAQREREMNRLQEERAELLKKYNNPISREQDIRARPRTPDALPKRNVYEVKRGPAIPSQNNQPVRPSDISRPVPSNQYIIRK